MDLAYIGGLFVALFVLVLGVFAGGVAPSSLIDVASILITAGGSIATVVMSNPLALSMKIPTIFKQALNEPKVDLKSKILQIVSFSEKARRDGLLALEDDMDKLDDTFLKKALQLVVDGTDPEIVRNVMQIEIDALDQRHAGNRAWFDSWGTMAPAFGMLGTLIGLVGMLANLGGDASSLGKAMAAALITTLYGSFIANVFALPVASKLKARTITELTIRQILLEGTLSIQAGDNPRIVMEKLVSYLPPVERLDILEAQKRD
ncbi:MAG: motility protein A [Leptospiraceae bacterium]|nr:motility protein A [Leptospiraceae bacterium]MCB1199176.1 motility protein A [Leptospiraceae bacterium]